MTLKNYGEDSFEEKKLPLSDFFSNQKNISIFE